MSREKVLEIFNHPWAEFYFTLGRGKPQNTPEELWYTHRGEIIGFFKVREIVRNLGDNLPKLESISGETSEWQIKLMNWVAICPHPFFEAPERTFMTAFRGWHYFDWKQHVGDVYSKVRV